MARQVTCPRCQTVLRVPDYGAGQSLTCPRCLAEIVPSTTPGGAPLRDTDGSALVIHANVDDQQSQPIGGAGDRVGCAVIK